MKKANGKMGDKRPPKATHESQKGTGEPVSVQRQRRLAELRYKTVKNGSPLEACLGMVQCDLLGFAGIMGNRLAKLLRVTPDSIDESEQQMRAFEQYLKVTKQIERYAQIRLKSEQLRADNEARKKEIQTALESEKSTK